ncbi:MAG: hypothetical protein COU25_03600 [Candidatus Levybacteria bacterium CG10_big_fil_rev_8_21_14_0_10_35_13]|nr:MAG: hypothetical protein COU25_03600 [Candidatus Levybacteria bacterium CG10_big_fil_rev_8_21_14_0_10_35_13]
MQKRQNLLYIFLIFLILSILIFFASQFSFLRPVTSIIQNIVAPIQSLTYRTSNSIFSLGLNPKIKTLQEQNLTLSKKLVDQSKSIADNKALRDQFATAYPKSSILLPADIIGSPSFIPGIFAPEDYILNKGEKDGVKKGQAVVYRDNIVGIITYASDSFSKAETITNSHFSLTSVVLSTQALGVVKGQGGGEMILDNVVLSQELKKDDLVITKGDVNKKGEGILPNLIVGKIVSVNKNPSDLFQIASVKSLLDFSRISKVFIIIGI